MLSNFDLSLLSKNWKILDTEDGMIVHMMMDLVDDFTFVGSRKVDKGHEGPKIHGNVYGLCKRDFQPSYEKGLFSTSAHYFEFFLIIIF